VNRIKRAEGRQLGGLGEQPEYGGPVVWESRSASVEPSPRMLRALAIVQKNLDDAGLGDYVMRLVDDRTNIEGRPAYWAGLPDGRFSASSNCYIYDDPAMTFGELTGLVAAGVQDTLIEVERVMWPSCLTHRGRWVEIRASSDSVAWWCEVGSGHVSHFLRYLATDFAG
jgi:hypothetical protein